MKRLRLGAISAAIAAGLAVSYGVLAHDFSALKDGSGGAIRSGFGDCIESAGSGGGCANVAASAAPAAMADKKEMMAESKAVASGSATAATAATAVASTAKASGGGSVANVKDGSGNSVTAGAGGCVESPGGSTSGCDGAAKTMAEKPAAAMAEKPAAAMAEAKATPAAAVASADSSTAVGGHQVGEATHGHLADGQKMPVHTGFGGCVNLGYSVNSPDHPADCAYQAGKAVASAPAPKPAPAPAAPAPAAPATPAPAAPAAAAPAPAPAAPSAAAPAQAAAAVPSAPATGVPGTVKNTGPVGSVDSAAAVMAAPPVSVPGTVRNTSPIGVDSTAGEMASADTVDSSDSFPSSPRRRAPRGALNDDSQAMDSGATGEALKDSPPPPPVPAPPTQIVRGQDQSMDIPAPTRPQSSSSSAGPSAPPTDVPGTVRNTTPTGDSAAPAGNVQMPAAKAAPIPAPEYEKISLSADVLFKFDRYREKDMLPSGRAKLDDVADKIKNYIVDTIDHIDLTGHTDRLGSDAYNQRLSERRATTVKGYLVKKGVDGGKISNKGRGEREPVVQCKGNKATKKLIRCLQPNRRVDVEIHGVKQK